MNDYSVEGLIARGSFRCSCGKTHAAHLKKAVIKSGAIKELPAVVAEYGGTKAFIIADNNTFAAAGEKVLEALERGGIGSTVFRFREERTEPDEKALGSVVLHFDHTCDIIIGIGSGVINDTAKIIAKMTGLHYIIVGTAPSMDGFASSTSSVIRDGLKVSVDSSCPDAVIGDLDVLCDAPLLMIRSGLGDMLAKYISVCEWRIGHIVTGEYYCEEVASIIRAALKKCVDNAGGIMTRDPEAVKAVTEGLIISGIAADYAGVSRPVSGVEHYFSHLWDMRALEFGTPWSLHGIQCGIGTVLALKGYERLVSLVPDREKAAAAFDAFDTEKWFSEIGEYLGGAAKTITQTAGSSERYNRELHRERLKKIAERYDDILAVIKEELPFSGKIISLLGEIGAPVASADIDIPADENALTFRMTKDIRDKYILSTLMWDMGILDEESERIYGA